MQTQRELAMEDFFKTEDLHPELACCVCRSSAGLLMIQHPLVHDFYVPEMAAMVNKQYETRKQVMREAEEQQDWDKMLAIYARPYRMALFARIADRLADSHYWETLAWIWRDSENIWQNRADWVKLWRSKRPNREAVMTEEERATLAGLPERLTVYRGTQRGRATGLSWTLDEKRAAWFAKRFPHQRREPVLVSAVIERRRVLAFFSGRQEQEIVVLPQHVSAAVRQSLSG